MPAREPIKVEDYAPFIGGKAVDRLKQKAKTLQGVHVNHINATYYGGGVATLLSSLVPLMSNLGINAEWSVIRGLPKFFDITKQFHNAIQGGDINLTKSKRQLYEQVIRDNAACLNIGRDDIVVVHDPQPLPIISHYRKRVPWIWRCHVDVTQPNRTLWNYFKGFVDQYDALIFSLPEYKQKTKTPTRFFMPAIDPFSALNRPMTDKDVKRVLERYKIPLDLPLITQISRFDKWKDPAGVIEAFMLAQKRVKATLVLVGNAATDDPEGQHVFESLLRYRSERIIISDEGDDTDLINALQRRSTAIVQKSIREGFGLTVTEALWKGTPVIGGNVGGIRHQIRDGHNGYLVSSISEAADRMVTLIKNKKLRNEMGRHARQTVKDKFLLTRYLEQYLDLFNAFETKIYLRD